MKNIKRNTSPWFKPPGTLAEQAEWIEKRLARSVYLRSQGEWLKRHSFAKGYLADDSPEAKAWLYEHLQRIRAAMVAGSKDRYIGFRN
jgi:hypothetical protein